MIGESRGQTATIGVILLFGIVAIGSMSILLVAGETVSDVEQNAATEHVTQGFVELSSELETVTYSRDTAKTMDMAVGENGAVRKENTGWIRINASDFEENISLGAVVYENDQGASVAYQAGGVWRGTGNETQIVSAPPVHYEDSTLTLPVNSVVGATEISSGELRVEHRRTKTFDNTSVENEIVTLEIKSNYYRGWADYFKSQTNDAVIEDVDHESNTVTIKLGRHELDQGVLDYAVVVSGDLNDQTGGGHGVDGATMDSYESENLNDEIADIIAEADTTDNQTTDLAAEAPLTAGTYFVDGNVTLTNEIVTADLQSGNVTLVVDGHVTLENGAEIELANEGDESFRVYSNGSIGIGQGHAGINRDGDPSNAQIYGTSRMNVSLGQNAKISGSVYAPREETVEAANPAAVGVSSIPNCVDYDVCLDDGGATITGSVTAGSVYLGAGGNSIEYDPDVAESELSLQPENFVLPPEITYLNVVEHEIEIADA